MIFFIYQRATKSLKVLKKDEKVLYLNNKLTKHIWELAEAFPEDIIGWCEDELYSSLDLNTWGNIFHHDLIMASFANKTSYISDDIGYIDQLPFININRNVLYPTWRMSTDVGGIRGQALIEFKDIFKHIDDFGFLLNSIAKLGQQNGLMCYSAPQLLTNIFGYLPQKKEVKNTAKPGEMFSFVYAHYKTIRVFLLFWCYMKYERTFPFRSLLITLFQKKYFKKDIDLSGIELHSNKQELKNSTIDVIIPSLGRRDYLLQVLEDLKAQTLLPKKVIVVEQNPNSGAKTELLELETESWPFEIIHHFIHKTGACNARNIAIEEVDADWVFFADDDIRFNPNLLKQSLSEISRLGADCLNINCKQEGEETVFQKIKQWGSFGSGTSIAKVFYCKKIRFDEIFEYGFGEDQDFGMQLRNAGCDIIYHPIIEILHLKAPRGGFRDVLKTPWEQDNPKPSPTLMVYAKKYYSLEQMRGFKTELFLRFYFRQEIKNPVKYYYIMRKRWEKSEVWATKIISGKDDQNKKAEFVNEF